MTHITYSLTVYSKLLWRHIIQFSGSRCFPELRINRFCFRFWSKKHAGASASVVKSINQLFPASVWQMKSACKCTDWLLVWLLNYWISVSHSAVWCLFSKSTTFRLFKVWDINIQDFRLVFKLRFTQILSEIWLQKKMCETLYRQLKTNNHKITILSPLGTF